MTKTTKAVIFIPPGIPDDGLFARQALLHIERRGYDLACMPVRVWEDALHLLRARLATVIVFARPEHFEPHWEPRVEFVGEQTQRLCAQPKDSNDRRSRFRGGGVHRRPRLIN